MLECAGLAGVPPKCPDHDAGGLPAPDLSIPVCLQCYLNGGRLNVQVDDPKLAVISSGIAHELAEATCLGRVAKCKRGAMQNAVVEAKQLLFFVNRIRT
jgi:hypothetical protein